MLSGMAVADVAKPHDEVRGQGSALLMIPGVGGDAGYYAQASEELADAFTVITYGRRGNSRSTGGTDGPMTVAQQADDEIGRAHV